MPLFYRERPPIPFITDGLILHLDAFNSSSYPGSGTEWYDLTENANTASLQNTTFLTESVGRKYFSFNGSNSLAIIPENSNFNTQTISVEVWVKTNNLNQNGGSKIRFDCVPTNNFLDICVEKENGKYKSKDGCINDCEGKYIMTQMDKIHIKHEIGRAHV